jgi:hypothetical protein
MGYNMVNKEADDDFLSERQQIVFKGAVLLLCAAILALVFTSGRHETRTEEQCGQSAARAACLSELSATSTHAPVKGALAPLGRASSAQDGTN